MSDIGIISLEICCIQLSGAWLCCLPFRQQLTPVLQKRLLQRFLLWSLSAWCLQTGVFFYTGIQVIAFQLLLIAGWLPFFLILLSVIRHRLLQHIFLTGMYAIYFLILQSLSLHLSWLLPLKDTAQHLELHSLLYLAFFFLLLPAEKRIFGQLLPSRHFMDAKKYGSYIALLPLCLFLSQIAFFLDPPVHAWNELLSQALLAVCFGLLYRYSALETADDQQQNRKSHENQLREQQLHALQDHTLLMQDSQRQLSVLRHDMRHHTRLLYTLLTSNKTAEALQVLQSLDNNLENTVVHAYCRNPIVNAALTIYICRAQKFHILVKHRIDLPERLPNAENDLAVLLSNLIENATLASLKEPADQRAIELYICRQGKQFLLNVCNRFSGQLVLNEDGLPITAAAGHGTGMVSLASFAQKYNATTQYTQLDGWVRLFMYWTADTEE